MLILGSVYKNPIYLFFDESTNVLDANNESQIVENMNAFTSGKTVMVVAHRLSNVNHAHQIVVLHEGEIVDFETRVEMIALRDKV